MAEALSAERKATAVEVRAHAATIRRLARDLGLDHPRLREDGAVVVHSAHPGYREVNQLSREVGEVIGAYVHVITDDVPGAASATDF